VSECVHAVLGADDDCPLCDWDGEPYGFGYEPPSATAYDNAMFKLKHDAAICRDGHCVCVVSWVAKDKDEHTTMGAGDAMRWTPAHPVLRFA
jgi:hypothetical protein